MKNVLLATTALVAMAGAASAELSLGGSADFGYNDAINGGVFLDSAFNVNGSVDLADGYSATFTYGFDVDTSGGNTGLSWDDFPTVEITGPMGSLKGGDLDDAGASEYFYADRDGMAVDVENQDSGTEFGIRGLVEFGTIGLAFGGEMASGSNAIDGYNIGVGATFGNFTVGLGYDEADAGTVGNTGTVATTAVSVDTTFGAASIGLSYASGVENSTGVEVGYDISADLTVAAYYANNSVSDDAYGVSADYTMGDLSVGAYFDSGDGATLDTYGVDVAYAVSGELTVSAGVYDDGTAGNMDYYVGGVYSINDNLSATISYATADEISGPEFKDGTTVMVSMSF